MTSLGSSISMTVDQLLLESSLVRNLKPILPNINPQILEGQGAATSRSMISREQLREVSQAYNNALRSIWYLLLGLADVILISGLGLEWKRVKDQKSQKTNEEKHSKKHGKEASEAADQDEKPEIRSASIDSRDDVNNVEESKT